jgi:hypothetical protein
VVAEEREEQMREMQESTRGDNKSNRLECMGEDGMESASESDVEVGSKQPGAKTCCTYRHYVMSSLSPLYVQYNQQQTTNNKQARNT